MALKLQYRSGCYNQLYYDFNVVQNNLSMRFTHTICRKYVFTILILFSFLFLFLVMSGFMEAKNNLSPNQLFPGEDSLKITLPKEGRLVDGKPIGKHWVNLLNSQAGWNMDTSAYTLSRGSLHGDYYGGKFHNFAWTKKVYKNFELQALVKLSGKDANSGVCIRINPVNADNAPGYQVDMGEGYWGCLWKKKGLVWFRNFRMIWLQNL